ncbi:MAG: lysostaphin resistance A-like protein [Terracidiphilus sp.]
MEPEIQPPLPEAPSAGTAADAALTPGPLAPAPNAAKFRRLRWIFGGSQGLRAGWSALVNLLLILLAEAILIPTAAAIHPFKIGDTAPLAVLLQVLTLYLAVLGVGCLNSLVRKRGLRWVFLGSQGLRAGWSVLTFVALAFFFIFLLATIASTIRKALHAPPNQGITALTMIIGESIAVLAIAGAAALLARIERRSSILAYNLTGSRRLLHLFSGLAAGFAALSALVGAMAWGGWLHFGPPALSGPHIFSFAALWGIAFLLVGCFEEGTFRCYLQFTLTRGINFWWALGIVSVICLRLLLSAKGNGLWGVYAIALLGLVPCLLLHLKKAEGAGFWQAAWVTSTLFGFIHTGNNGENWIGIFAAAFIGFVFCVSVRVTGSAWWAIGCHAAWDWAETYFYGTADSGMVAPGHYLTTSPAGNALWSGGADGPEGSLLVLPVILLLLVALLVIYGRRKPAAIVAPTTEQLAG